MTTETSQDSSDILLLEDVSNPNSNTSPPVGTRHSRHLSVQDDDDQSGPTQITQLGDNVRDYDNTNEADGCDTQHYPCDIPHSPLPICCGPSPVPRTPSPISCAPSPAPCAPSPAPRAPSPAPHAPSPAPRTPSPVPHAPSPIPCAPSPVPRAPSWEIDNAVAAGKADKVGDLLIYPRLETKEHCTVFQPGDSIRCGKSACRILGIVADRDELKLLCVSNKRGSAAKMIQLKKYTRLSSDLPDELCEEALSQWIAAKIKESQLTSKRHRSSPAFFEEAKTAQFAVRSKRKHQEHCMAKEQPQKKAKLNKESKQMANCSSNPRPERVTALVTTAPAKINYHSASADPCQVPKYTAPVLPKVLDDNPNPELLLRLRLNEYQLHRLRHQMLTNELHAHEEREHLRRLLEEQQVQDIEDESLLLRALTYH